MEAKPLQKHAVPNVEWTPYTNMHLQMFALCKHLCFSKLFS
jgi:hypothetical protein